MRATVFRPKRKGKVSRLWVGRYRLDDMPTFVQVSLDTPDELVARHRLHQIIVRRQRQAEGLAAPDAMRTAQHAPFADVVEDYATDLRAQGRRAQHIKDTTRRVLRIARECRWKRIGDANAAAFTTWRGKVADSMSAKMLKEYGVSLRAFYRWMIDTERFDRDPFARVKAPVTRGRETRIRRAFTEDEARRLIAVSGYHRLPYLTMFYTGLRYKAAWGLRWCDYLTDSAGGGPRFVIPADKDKGKRERVIPVRAELAAELEAHRAECRKAGPRTRIFAGIFPRQRTDKKRPNSLRVDMAKAGIPVRDERGRVIDYHSFRMTFGTWAQAGGVPLRAAQTLLGHSTPEMTARHYTDESGLALPTQVHKLVWIGAENAPAQDSPASESESETTANALAEMVVAQLFSDGGRHRTRTCDPIRVKDVL